MGLVCASLHLILSCPSSGLDFRLRECREFVLSPLRLQHIDLFSAHSRCSVNIHLQGFLHQVRAQHLGKLRLPEADATLRAEADASTALSCLLSTPGMLTPFPHLTLALTPASQCYPSLGPDRHSLVLSAAPWPGLLEVKAISRQGSGLDFCSRLGSTTSHCPFSLPWSPS